MNKEDKYSSSAPKEAQITVDNDQNYPNKKVISGNSVDEHKELEVANMELAEKEIGQQFHNG